MKVRPTDLLKSSTPFADVAKLPNLVMWTDPSDVRTLLRKSLPKLTRQTKRRLLSHRDGGQCVCPKCNQRKAEMLDKISTSAIPAQMPQLDRDALEDYCNVSSNESAGQLTVRIKNHLWVRMQRPKRLDVFGTADGEWYLKRGDTYAVQEPMGETGAAQVSLSSLKVGIHRANRATAHTPAQVRGGGKLVLGAMPADWIGEAPAPVVEEPAPTPTETTEPITVPLSNGATPHLDPHDWRAQLKAFGNGGEYPSEPVEDKVRLSVRKNVAGCTLCVAITQALKEAIGNPTHVHIHGTVHEGITITPAPGYGDGLKLQQIGEMCWITSGIGNKGLTKEARRIIEVDAVAKEGKIKVSGPNYEWTRCAPQWKPKKDRENEGPPQQPHLARPDINPSLSPADDGKKGNGMVLTSTPAEPVAAPAPTAPAVLQHFAEAHSNNGSDVNTIRACLNQVLKDAKGLKDELEQKTGLKFRINSALQLVMVME